MPALNCPDKTDIFLARQEPVFGFIAREEDPRTQYSRRLDAVHIIVFFMLVVPEKSALHA
ncbi:MAG: hypothetical protein MI923_07135 [Phycisphaerales bacterium]|nr:hypothetical protein [Phycisphaerales bacterium]